ncbi:hypothetical protein ACLKA7_001501 [Drosophila subpalustris]
MLGINGASKDDIVSRGHQLFIRFGKISVSGLMKGAEKAGTAEAPPPAVQEKTADPTDPLEDLPEDEDLADLTLDPAMAAEIEEQMATSTQEISDELEAALTTCNDEEDFSSPSTCNMEPLL